VRKLTRRERSEQRKRREVLKRAAPPNQPRRALYAAQEMMKVRDTGWLDVWSEVEFLDARLMHLQSLLENPISEALVIVADAMRATLTIYRDNLLAGREYRPETPGELWTGTSYDHKFL